VAGLVNRCLLNLGFGRLRSRSRFAGQSGVVVLGDTVGMVLAVAVIRFVMVQIRHGPLVLALVHTGVGYPVAVTPLATRSRA
jgi:hypothetical protein